MMDQTNETSAGAAVTVLLLPSSLKMLVSEAGEDQQLEFSQTIHAVYLTVLPLLVLFLVLEVFRRSMGRKLSIVSQVSDVVPKVDELVHVEGHCAEGYEQVKRAFRSNFEKDWEKGGAALCVYHRGKLVADLWGGFADREARRLWRQDTMGISFSSTKAVSALCIAVLVDRGCLSYDDLVVKYWPEFGKHGKSQITIQWVLSHMAGLAYLDQPLHFEDAKSNPERIARLFEEQTPNWIPGSNVGYHALTYGWLLDQIVRRADLEHRSLGEFYRQEVAGKIDGGADYHIGLPSSEAARVARVTLPNLRQRISEFVHNPWAVYYYRYFKDFWANGLLSRVERTPEWLRFVFEMTLNNPEIYALEQGALMGIGTARGLAKIFQSAIMEGGLFRSSETLQRFLTPYIHKEDIVSGALVSRGNGLMFSPFKLGERQFRMIGHAGYGGQNIKFDPDNELVFCYLSNALKAGFGDSARTFVALRDSIYSSVVQQQEKSKTH